MDRRGVGKGPLWLHFLSRLRWVWGAREERPISLSCQEDRAGKGLWGAYLVPLHLKQGNWRTLMLQSLMCSDLDSAAFFLCTSVSPLSSLHLPVSLGTQG